MRWIVGLVVAGAAMVLFAFAELPVAGTAAAAPPVSVPAPDLAAPRLSGAVDVEEVGEVPEAGPVVVASDGSVEFFTLARSTETLLVARETATGTIETMAVLSTGDLDVRTVSHRGDRVTLGERLPEGASIYAPGPRKETALVVVDVGRDRIRRYDVSGNVEPEAFSTRGDRLFVIEHVPAEAPVRYRVASLNLASGELEPVLGPDKKPLDEEMQGIGRRQVFSPGGDVLYTLYTRQDSVSPHGHQGFVHVLYLTDGFAVCIDLPHGFGEGEVGTADLAVDGTGDVLWVIDTHTNRAARLDTTADGPLGVAVSEVVDLPALWRGQPVTIEAWDDGGLDLDLAGTAMRWEP